VARAGGDGEVERGMQVQLGVNDNLLKLNRSENPGVAVRRFRPRADQSFRRLKRGLNLLKQQPLEQCW